MHPMTYYDKLFRLCSHMYKQTPQDFENWKLVDSFSADDGLFVSIFKTDADEYVLFVNFLQRFSLLNCSHPSYQNMFRLYSTFFISPYAFVSNLF